MIRCTPGVCFFRWSNVPSEQMDLEMDFNVPTVLTSTMHALLRSIIRITGRGYNIGLRLVDELIAKSSIIRCEDFKETCEVVAKVRTTFAAPAEWYE